MIACKGNVTNLQSDACCLTAASKVLQHKDLGWTGFTSMHHIDIELNPCGQRSSARHVTARHHAADLSAMLSDLEAGFHRRVSLETIVSLQGGAIPQCLSGLRAGVTGRSGGDQKTLLRASTQSCRQMKV
eukprot:s3614_g8.t1